MNRKGVCYDVGRVLEGSLQRIHFDLQIIHRELDIIKNVLHCNAVRIQGFDLDRLSVATKHALDLGLEVWFSPEMFEKSQEETLDYLIKAAKVAEILRRGNPDIVFSLGSELTLFMQGIVEGENLMERMNNPSFWSVIRSGKHNAPLNEFLAKANKAVREIFHGKVTYFSVPFEEVDWSNLDFVGMDLYRDTRNREYYDHALKLALSHGKPVLIGEFGCCTYLGAEELGGMGWAIIFGIIADLFGDKVSATAGFSEYTKILPKVDGHYVRDEGLQAREVVEQLRLQDVAGIEGAFVFTFVSPNSSFNEDPRFDMDLGSYSLVKSYPDRESMDSMVQGMAGQVEGVFATKISEDTIARFFTNLGRSGTTYPEMPWEPKESFWAVSNYYSGNVTAQK